VGQTLAQRRQGLQQGQLPGAGRGPARQVLLRLQQAHGVQIYFLLLLFLLLLLGPRRQLLRRKEQRDGKVEV